MEHKSKSQFQGENDKSNDSVRIKSVMKVYTNEKMASVNSIIIRAVYLKVFRQYFTP